MNTIKSIICPSCKGNPVAKSGAVCSLCDGACVVLITVCSTCGNEIDPTVCGCGEAIGPGITHDNHYPVPAGCACFRETGTDPDFGGDYLAVGRTLL